MHLPLRHRLLRLRHLVLLALAPPALAVLPLRAPLPAVLLLHRLAVAPPQALPLDPTHLRLVLLRALRPPVSAVTTRCTVRMRRPLRIAQAQKREPLRIAHAQKRVPLKTGCPSESADLHYTLNARIFCVWMLCTFGRCPFPSTRRTVSTHTCARSSAHFCRTGSNAQLYRLCINWFCANRS
jgi:hypothetical protein